MALEDLGYSKTLEDYRQQHNLGAFEVGRVAQEHKDRYVVVTDAKTLDGELIGNLRYTATSRNDLPVVGDWVAISEYDEGKGLIHAVLPRFSVLERQAIGKYGEAQLIASNVDYGLIIQSVNRDFNINRLERYLTLCYASKIKPIIVVTKTDLTDVQKVNVLLDEINNRIKNVSIVAVSNKTQMGMDDLKKLIYKGKTYCLLGSSGVGKSSLINSLSGAYLMKTGSISERIDRGKHVTTHRELISLINGAILIDNPGMREVGITDASGGLESTFEKIYELTQHCKFSDCTHTTEQGCAVISAIEKGEIEESFFENYLKMEREKEHFESTVAEKRKKDKDFGKMIKQYKKSKNSNRN
ncbi:ribosome small subunit-dependent GTPase A [Aestuariibaculum lutulentum]|uniref:Small ribosomal subunit biogenesis GTPase RsgA n=1 Tax=Aestuariibaculum lutulentum TaxID=2920935 RepID=A0ABS9RIX0_9FLAO|nr:ribosome small subunit-dependent GTPase A [Aestuariibaculum lutulentum]MCH4552900.1 ribosome small subunit-dependent GTPase A [Aestuariibaculum lutulentum]